MRGESDIIIWVVVLSKWASTFSSLADTNICRHAGSQNRRVV